MEWDEDNNVIVDHPRVPWAALGRTSTIVHCKTEMLKGTADSLGPANRAQAAAQYRAAKFKFKMPAAFDVVERIRHYAAVTPSSLSIIQRLSLISGA